jgi:DNA-binding CsgD family transcriptional regulator
MKTWNLYKIEEAFTAAAVEPNLWSSALDCVSAQTESRGALILPIQGNPLPHTPISEGVARATEAYFRDGWHSRDERNRGAPTLIRNGVADDFDSMPAEMMRRHPYYQEFLAPAGLRWFAGVKMGAGDDFWCLSIQRGLNELPFSPEEKRQLGQLSRVLSTVAAFTQALGFAASSALLEAFDVSQTAAVLLNRRAEVVRTNRSADHLLREDICIVGKRLVAMDKTASSALDHALHRLLWAPTGASLMPAIPLPRIGKPPILAYPLKVPSLSVSAMAEAQAAIVLIDPAKRRRSPESNLQRAFQLTPAEARLASHMADGSSLETVCEQLGIAKETGRNQLKNVFAKTDTHRQSELVLVLAQML